MGLDGPPQGGWCVQVLHCSSLQVNGMEAYTQGEIEEINQSIPSTQKRRSRKETSLSNKASSVGMQLVQYLILILDTG